MPNILKAWKKCNLKQIKNQYFKKHYQQKFKKKNFFTVYGI